MNRVFVMTALMLCAAFPLAVRASDAQTTDGFRNVPVQQLDTCLGKQVRLHFPGDKVREGKLVSCDSGWVVLEQRYGSGTTSVRLVEKHIEKVELQTDATLPRRRAGTVSIVDQSQALIMPAGASSLPSSPVTVVGRPQAAPSCRLAR